jgi:hypothetical protein
MSLNSYNSYKYAMKVLQAYEILEANESEANDWLDMPNALGSIIEDIDDDGLYEGRPWPMEDYSRQLANNTLSQYLRLELAQETLSQYLKGTMPDEKEAVNAEFAARFLNIKD